MQFSTLAWQNVAIGDRALQFNTNGYQNVAIGEEALQKNYADYPNGPGPLGAYTGQGNVAVGAFSQWSPTNGAVNTSIGAYSLYNLNTGVGNTALGEETMWNALACSSNTAVGYASMYLTTLGQANTAVGMESLFNSPLGSFNTAIGALSLHDTYAPSNNVAVGYSAGYVVQGGNNLILGAFAQGPGAYHSLAGSIVLGFESYATNSFEAVLGNSNITQTLIFGNVVVPTLTSTGVVNILGPLNAPGQVNTLGAVVVTNATGQITLSAGVGYGALVANGRVQMGSYNSIDDLLLNGASDYLKGELFVAGVASAAPILTGTSNSTFNANYGLLEASGVWGGDIRLQQLSGGVTNYWDILASYSTLIFMVNSNVVASFNSGNLILPNALTVPVITNNVFTISATSSAPSASGTAASIWNSNGIALYVTDANGTKQFMTLP
jgi:hypothetical protein